MQISITRATTEDIVIIQSLIQQIWKPTYRHILSEAQMDYMLDMMYSTEVLEEQFKEGHIFLLILLEGKPVGFAGYQNNYKPDGVCKLHKIYVLPDMQGMQLGKKLFETVKEETTKAGQQKLILNVNRYNKAADFYKKLGMQIAEEVDVEIGNGYFMNDYVMSIDL
ncbi:GNAT family N-acetyltransferase [Taibaiella lutea]|uniref:GNAT family N-acetyltransferase n=1 Tax=Taibaiella lutea TaxID=2608001 RepID=A0A5M6CPL9_9BACT|nr:GNAT family N-acetyltransferase [Taibaiella lutea]KAA5537027.1 GNAT family N-acetyltransferase [Taibaiella lutea]